MSTCSPSKTVKTWACLPNVLVDYCTELNNYIQARPYLSFHYGEPTYEGPEHERTHRMTVLGSFFFSL